MKSQREIYEAMLAGKTLRHKTGFSAKLNNVGKEVYSQNGIFWGASTDYVDFNTAEDWSILQEPRVVWAVICDNGSIYSTHITEEGAKKAKYNYGGPFNQVIRKFIEVIE